MITKLFEFLSPFESHSYIIIFALLIACGLGLPIPEDVTLVLGGVTSSYKITNFWLIVLVSMIGVLGGDSIVFVLGRYLGHKILKSKFLSKIVKPRSIARVKLASAKYGNYLLFFGLVLHPVEVAAMRAARTNPTFFNEVMVLRLIAYFTSSKRTGNSYPESCAAES